jgi:hypothetical protein
VPFLKEFFGILINRITVKDKYLKKSVAGTEALQQTLSYP